MRISALLVLMAAGCSAAERPMAIVTDDEMDPLRSAIARKEAWTQEAARRLQADANRRMILGPWSVTTDRPGGAALDAHDYYSEAPYYWPNPDDPSGPYILRDGHLNPDRFSANRNALDQMSEAVFSLGAAAYLFDDARYAQRAARIIQAWFLNPKTRMNPTLEYAGAIRGLNTGRPGGIQEGRVFIRAIQGMEFLSRTDSWDLKDQAAVRKWFEDYLRWLTQSRNGVEEKASGYNQASWWTAQVAAVARFVENDAVEKTALSYYRERVLPRPIAVEGSAVRDEGRNSFYSVLNLEAFSMVCRIAEVEGLDLWSARAKGGSDLMSALDGLEPYLSERKKNSREQYAELETDGIYFLAFAGMGLKKPKYIALYQKLERPDTAWLIVIDLLVGRWEAAGHQTRH